MGLSLPHILLLALVVLLLFGGGRVSGSRQRIDSQRRQRLGNLNQAAVGETEAAPAVARVAGRSGAPQPPANSAGSLGARAPAGIVTGSPQRPF